MLENLFSRGYRPFFLLGAVNAWASMLPWLYVLSGGEVPTQGWPPHTLHAHEILYGTVVPAIAGFLLTAVPNWTHSDPVVGRPLAGLLLLWLAGRVALVLAGPLDPLAVAVIDVSFLPVLAWTLARPIVGARSWRNLPILAVLLGVATANASIHLGLARSEPAALRMGTYGAVYLIVLLMLIVSGRLIPLFTRNTLERLGTPAAITTIPSVGALGIAVGGIALGLDLVYPANSVSGWLALMAAPVLLLRQSRWQPHRTLRQPMLWILHLGHGWLVLGFALFGASNLWGSLMGAGALHAFTAGAMGTLMLGVMSRVTLGHSGRPIEASTATVVAFGFVVIGAAIRVASASPAMGFYAPGVLVGGSVWAAAWIVWTASYAAALVGPRVGAAAQPGPG
jgi:uncharacterized protein involved in response to NO